jgi:tetratricopeptide (TPR) repeat protein
LGDILELKADHTPALQAYQKAQSLVPQAERIWQTRLYRKSGIVLREQRLYAQALEAGFRAEEALGSQPEGDSPGWWDEWLDVQVDQVWARYWLARWPEMEALVNRLWPIVEKRGKPLNRMRFLRASLLMRMRRERYVVSDEMLADSRESLALCQEWGDMKSRVEHTFELGFLHLWRHELDQAEGCLLDSLELVESFGSVPMRALTLTYLTVVCRFRGQIEGVSDYAQHALEIAQAARMPDYVATARGNQAWLAWRRHDLPAAQIKGREALELWQHSPLVYPFQWIALFPLIGIALAQNRQVEAWDHVRVLLEPTQQLLPEALNAALEAALHSKTSSQPNEARLHLGRAVELAAQMGYL